jgi:hypothetical protein
MAPAMISCLKKALWFFVIAFGSTSFANAQSTFFQVASTPYDRQMSRVEPILAAPSRRSVEGPSLALVNNWISQLRNMPYHYSREWCTPFEVETAMAADCKGKALLLYDWMQLSGARNLRLVIGKRQAFDSLTHAWLEWDTQMGTVLLDPTFNWTASIKAQDGWSYIPFYGYQGAHKYRAGTSLLANRSIANRNPAAPAHGAITRPMAVPSRMPANPVTSRSMGVALRMPPSPLLFDQGPIRFGSLSVRSGL